MITVRLVAVAAIVWVGFAWGCTPNPATDDDDGPSPSSSSAGGGGAGPSTPDPEAALPFALLELFTSEGCSSCPPADTVIEAVVAEQRASGARVLTLAWHVDYWNYLGHLDAYSSPLYTARQEAYAVAMGASQMYTPQLLINTLVRSADKSAIDGAVAQALASPVSVSTTLWLDQVAPGAELTVNFMVFGAPAVAKLHVALVERDLVTQVVKGENAGKTLTHDNAVRAYATTPAAELGQITIEVPADAVLASSSLIAFVQEDVTMNLWGATMIDVVPASEP